MFDLEIHIFNFSFDVYLQISNTLNVIALVIY